MPIARKGKVARLPHSVREELNRRLLDNQDGARICAWVNKEQKLRKPAAITVNNLSEWRGGGFEDWLKGQEKVERTKQLSEFALRMATAGGGSMDLPAAIAGGQIMEVLEEFDPSTLKGLLVDKPEAWLGILDKLARLQKSKAEEAVVRQNEVRLGQSERKLILEELRFQRTTAEMFVKFYADKRAQEVMENKALKPSVRIEEIRKAIFGEVVPDGG